MIISTRQRDLLQSLTEAANGMLPLEVYEEIYRTSALSKARRIVEIGTAHGAATIALGLGAVSSSCDVAIWTVDKLGGRFSSRSAFGDVQTNRLIVENNITKAGLAGKVTLFIGDPDEFANQSDAPKEIDLLMLDADGRIDRDLLNFYPRLAVGAPVIIDDADTKIWINRNHEKVPFIDNKHRVTELLLNGFCKAGFLKLEKRVANTAFCTRTSKPHDERLFTQVALGAYRQIVICEVNDNYWNELAKWNEDRSLVRQALQIRKRIPAAAFKWIQRLWAIVKRSRLLIKT